MLTVTSRRPSAPPTPDAPFTLSVPGLDGQQIPVIVP